MTKKVILRPAFLIVLTLSCSFSVHGADIRTAEELFPSGSIELENLIYKNTTSFDELERIGIFEKSYSDLTFTNEYDKSLNDWKITVTVPGRKADKATKVFYWSGGSMLPPEELENKDKYWTLLYGYEKVLRDPADYTEEERAMVKEFSSKENRRNGAGTPMFFFDFIYDSYTRRSLESHLTKISFLGHTTNIHERIKDVLLEVSDEIMKEAQTDEEVKAFVDGLKSTDSYYWRIIDGTNRKSFHSLGIAMDVLPKKYGGKEVFWSWARDKNPSGWMFTPLSKRWMPPAKVIEIFEKHGFIWGGKWAIWDNMHFEYHPELINYNFGHNNKSN